MKTTATFALLGAVSLLASGASAEMEKRSSGSMGKHMKMVKRVESEMNKRNNDVAPFGYDHCGNPKKAQEKRHNGPSPSPHHPSASPSHHACPSRKYNPSKTYGPSRTHKPSATPKAQAQGSWGKEQYQQGQEGGKDAQRNNAEAPVDYSNGSNDAGSKTNEKGAAVVDSGNGDAANNWSGDNSNNWNGDNSGNSDNNWSGDNSAANSATWSPDAGAPDSTTPAWVDASTTTWSPEGVAQAAEPTSSSVEDWSSSSDSWSSSSSSEDWTPSSSDSWTPSSSDSWTPEPSSSSEPSPAAEEPTWSAPVKVGAAAPTPAVPIPAGNGGKVGLAWDWQNPYDAISKWAGASYVYTWSAFPPSGTMPDGMTWYPQYWGPSKQGDFESQVAAGAIRPGMTILGWNEPDQPGQANMSIEDGIREYKRLITPYASQGYTLATPGCTSDDNGFNWISGFIAGCNGECGFSVLQTHYYGTDAGSFIAYIEKLHNTFGLPIIVSEYAAETFGNGPDLSLPETQAFLAATQAFLDSADYVLSYMFFGAVTSKALNGVNPNNLLITDSGDITALGYQYLSS